MRKNKALVKSFYATLSLLSFLSFVGAFSEGDTIAGYVFVGLTAVFVACALFRPVYKGRHRRPTDPNLKHTPAVTAEWLHYMTTPTGHTTDVKLSKENQEKL